MKSELLIEENVDDQQQERHEVIEVVPSIDNVLPSEINPPPPWLLWLTVAVAIITLLWRVFCYLRQRLNSIGDDYWYRQINMPVCVEPLINLIELAVKDLRALDEKKGGSNSNSYNDYLLKFKKEKNSVLSRFMVLGSNDSDLYFSVSKKIDNIDDVVTQHCAFCALDSLVVEEKTYTDVGVVEQHLYKSLRDVLQLLEKEHKRKYKW